MKRSIELWLISAVLLTYTAAKARHMGMTCDETSTFFNFVLKLPTPSDLWWSREFWRDANNHWLNSVLMQVSFRIFGDDEWALRLPNWLAHILYLAASGALVIATVKDRFWRFAAFALLNSILFLLDFFALGRGYGLCVGFVMATFWALQRFSVRPTTAHGLMVWAMAALAVLSNFTALDFVAALAPVYAWVWWKSVARRWQSLVLPAVLMLVLAAFVQHPVRLIMALGEFHYGISDMGIMLRDLMTDVLYGAKPFGEQSDFVLCYIFSVVCGLYVLYAIWQSLRNATLPTFTNASVMLLAMLLLVMFVRHTLLDADYPRHRQALLLIPTIAVPFSLAAYELLRFHRIAQTIAGLLVVLGVGLQFKNANVNVCREWYYDKSGKDAMYLMAAMADYRPTVRIAVHWAYNPSMVYYRRKLGLESTMDIAPLNTPDTIGLFDLYYLEASQLSQISKKYEHVRTFDLGATLVRHKNFLPAKVDVKQ